MAWEFEKVNQETNTQPQWEFEPVNIPNQTVLDNKTGQSYSVPVTMDGTDTQFAIDTQVNGEDKSNYFAKTKVVDDDYGVLDYAKGLGKAHLRGHVEFAGGFATMAEHFLSGERDIREYKYQLEKNKKESGESFFEAGFFNPDPSMGYTPVPIYTKSKEETEKAIASGEKAIKTIEESKKKIQEKWHERAEKIISDEELEKHPTLGVVKDLTSSADSIAVSALTTVATRNPYVGAAMVAGVFGMQQSQESYEKAIEGGYDPYTARGYGNLQGGINAGLEFAGTKLLSKFAHLAPIRKVTDTTSKLIMKKLITNKATQATAKKIGRATLKAGYWKDVGLSGLSESFEEIQQSFAADIGDNIMGLESFSFGEMGSRALYQGALAFFPSAGIGAAGGLAYNRKISRIHSNLADQAKQIAPDLTEQEASQFADAAMEVLYQQSSDYADATNEVLDKELDADALPDNPMTPVELSENMERILRDTYGYSDEEIKKMVDVFNKQMDVSKQYTTTYNQFYDALTKAGRGVSESDSAARLFAARALTIAQAEGTTADEVVKRWHLQFKGHQYKQLPTEIAEQAKADKSGDMQQYLDKAEEQYNNVLAANNIDYTTMDFDEKAKQASMFMKTAPVDMTMAAPLSEDMLNEVDWANKETYNQEENDLVVYHSINASDLQKAIDFGGLAVPSLAITKSTTPFDFTGGGITLVGNKEMIDPTNRRNEVYDRDIWSKTFPHPTYKKPLNKTIQLFKNNVLPFFKRTDSTSRLGSLLYPVEQGFAPENAVDEFQFSDGAKLMYVEEVLNEKIDVPTVDRSDVRKKDLSDRYCFDADEKFFADIKNMDVKGFTKEFYDKVFEIVESAIERSTYKGREKQYADKLKQIAKEIFVNDDGSIDYINLELVYTSAKEIVNEKSQKEVDTYALRDLLNEKITDRDAYDSWAEKYIEDNLLGQKMIKVGKKYLPFTLENVVKDMTMGLTKNAQQGLVYGEGKVIAAAGKKLSSIKEIKDMSSKLVSYEEQANVYKQLKEEMDLFTDKFLGDGDLSKRSDNKEDAYRALGDLAEQKTPTKEFLQDRLNMWLGTKEKYSDELLQSGVNIANNVKNFARHYFEAKPQRAVRLNEFSGAIISTDKANDAVAKKLENLGIEVVRSDNQLEAIKDFSHTFFQNDNEKLRGSYTRAGRLNIIELFQTANPSTIIHEMAHFFLNDLRMYQDNPATKRQLEAIYKYVGSKDGTITTEQHEYFARSFEAYLMEGKAPNNTLKGVFNKFRNWLSKIYHEVKNLNVQLDDDIRKTFDEMLGGKMLDFRMDKGKANFTEKVLSGEIKPSVVKERIERLLKWSEPRTRGGKLVGRFPDIKINQQFDYMREMVGKDKAEAQQKIEDNVKLIDAIIRGDETGDIDALAWENKLLSIAAGRTNPRILLDVYDSISEMYNTGRFAESVTGALKKARRQRMLNTLLNTLEQGAGADWRKGSSKLKQFVRNLGRSYTGWNGLLDMLSMFDKGSKVGESALNDMYNVYNEELEMRYNIAKDGEVLSDILGKKLKSSSPDGISVSRYINGLQKKIRIDWGANSKEFTKDEIIDIYMKAQDPETRKIMLEDDILQYNEELLARVDENMTAEDKAFADSLFEFYDKSYEKLNQFYADHYGIALGKHKYYSPRTMDRAGIDVSTGDLSSFAGFSGVKKRTAKGGAIKIRGAYNVLRSYITNSNHWMSFADKLIDINSGFGDTRVKNIIRSLFGEDMNKRIAQEISRFATNDKAFAQKFDGWFSKLRANYAVSVLGAKPSITIKQLVSFPAYWENMSAKDFVAGVIDFAKNPKKAIETLAKSKLMQTRGVNIIRDLEIVNSSEKLKNLGTKTGFREFLMLNVQLGDRGAIYLGGWAVYKKVLNETGSEEKAMAAFEKVTNETQQSSFMSEQSSWQSNPFGALFTMFQSSQNQYLRKEINAIRGMLTGRMDAAKVGKTMFIYHFLLPMLFQFVSDGFRWDKDKQFRAATLGSLNGAFILGDMLNRIVDFFITGQLNLKKDVSELVPFLTTIQNAAKFVSRTAQFAGDDISLEEYIEALGRFSQTVGEFTGLPIKYIKDVALNTEKYLEDEEYKKAGLLWLGWSPYALRDIEE